MKKTLLSAFIFLIMNSLILIAQVNSRLVYVSNTYNSPEVGKGTLVFDVEALSDSGDVSINVYGNSVKLDDDFRDNLRDWQYSDHYFDEENYNYGPMEYNETTGVLSFVYSAKFSITTRKTLTGSWQKIVRITLVYRLADVNAAVKWNYGPVDNLMDGYRVKDEDLNDITGVREDIPAELSQVPLPVELVSFSGKVTQENSVMLKWKTATEVNNYGFEIERATLNGDNEEWLRIGFVEGSGSSNSPKSYTFTDKNVTGGNSFIYRLKQIDIDGSFSYFGEVIIKMVPAQFKLFQNYPNPFNPGTKIKFSLMRKEKVKISIYNVIGEKVLTLTNKSFDAGTHEIDFNANGLKNGIYFYRLQAGKYSEIKKMVLLK